MFFTALNYNSSTLLGGGGGLVPDLEGLLALEDVLSRVLLDELASLGVDDGERRQLGDVELRLERLLGQLGLERDRAPGHLGDVALEVVDLTVVGHEYDLNKVLLVAGLDGLPELLLQVGRVQAGGRRPVRTVVEADVLEALALGGGVPVGDGKLGVVGVHHLVSKKGGCSGVTRFH